ncbi:MAG: DNA translocase FtsK [Tissierellaceae bacterium]|nr:DNA translocase FtsK [Tissierellaceae bacterium]
MKKKKKGKIELDKEIIGIVLILLGILSIFSLFSDKTGIVGEFLKNIYLQLMGFGGFIFPLILIAIGIFFMANKLDIDEDRKAFYSIVIFLCVLTIIDISKMGNMTFVKRIQLAFQYGESGLGGGILGAFLGYIFFKLFGSIGSYIILSFVIVINIMLISEIKISKIKIAKLFSHRNKRPTYNSVGAKTMEEDEKKEGIKILDYTKNEEEKEDKKNNMENIKYENKDKAADNLKIFNSHQKNKTSYKFPPMEFLKSSDLNTDYSDKKEIFGNARKIEETMRSFGIDAHVTQISKGPTITLYELQPSPGVKVSKIVNLSDDIALNLASSDIRIEAPIPGKAAVGIEVPNRKKSNVYLKEILQSEEYNNISSKIPFALGKDISGKPIVANIEKMPHLLIAGATGSGKSVCINTIIMSILYKATPDEVKLLLIDPKVVELSIYNKIPHLLTPVVTDAKKAKFALNWAVEEMTRRYKIFAKNNVRDIYSYNAKVEKEEPENKLCQIVIIIDELADLMMVAAREIEDYICRLAQMARAAGMYLIIATQRPSVDVITGTIKANIPSRISFAVTSSIDSRTILDMGGGEKLLGKGDMLFFPSGYSKPVRIQGAFINEEEVEKVVQFLKEENEIEYDESIAEKIDNPHEETPGIDDDLLPDAIDLVINEGQASISFLQRKLKIGYSRAGRLIDEMERRGIVGKSEGSKPRKVLMDRDSINS